MADKVSSFVIAFDGSEGNIDSILSALKGKVRNAVSDIKSTTSKVQLFQSLEDDVQKAAAAFATATARVAELKAQIDSINGAGGTVGADLAAQFRLAETAATSASRAYNSQVTQLSALQTKLTAAGVNTGNLAAEQIRLANALKVATTAAAEQSAKGLLGFKTLGDVQPQITALTKAFDTLRLSGTLSSREIATAQELLRSKIAEVRGTVSQLGGAFSAQGDSISSFVSSAAGKLIGLVAAVGAVTGAISSVVSTSRAFSQGLTEIGTVSDLSKAELDALGESAKELALRVGIDVVDAVHQLKELIRSGIDPDNALLVLSQAAETAKASQQDLGAVVKIGTELLHGYGVQIGDLQKTFDLLFQGMKDGGPTFNELASSLGPLLSVAKLANVPITELVASLQVMVRAGLPAEQAIGNLTKIITKLDTKTAVAALAQLGIQSSDLVEIFTQLGDKGLDLNETLQLGLADKRSVAGLSALTSGAHGLRDEMDKLATSSGSVATALEKISETPKEKIERLSAAYEVLKTNIGKAAGESGGLLDIAIKLVQGLDLLAKGNFDYAQTLALIATRSSGAAPELEILQKLALSSAQALKTAVSSIAGAVDQQLATVKGKITEITGSLQNLLGNLQAQIAASQASTAAQIADLNARATAEIAALDKSTEAEKATADATLAIRTKLAADRLALIVKNAADILKATDDAAALELAVAKQSGKDISAVDQATAQAKLAVLAQIKGQLAAALADAVAQEQGYVTKINGIDATRVSFNQNVQDQLTAIRNEGLSDFDQYIAKTTQINTLLGQAQQAFQQGGAAGLALGKTYVDQVIALSGQLKTVVNADGVSVVSAFDVQQKKIEVITAAANLYNKALDGQEAAANAGKDASVNAIDAIAPKLASITQQYDALNTKVQAGLAIRIGLDENAISQAQTDLAAKLAERTFLIPIQADLAGVSKDVDGVIARLKDGVTAGVNTQLDAIGANLAKIAEKAPELKLDVGPATTLIDSLKASIGKIDQLKPHLSVDSNVADVQAAIDKLKLPTESTHTVHVRVEGGVPTTTSESSPVVPGFARGGIVGSLARARSAWQAFAGGGFTFPPLSSAKVPGTGDSDIVPASLPRGAFVMRKAASNFYGDGIMARLARGVSHFASGGFASSFFGLNDRGTGTTDPKELLMAQYVQALAQHLDHPADVAPVIDPKLGYQPGDSFQGNLPPPQTFDVRPVPANLVTAANVLEYAQEMLLRVGVNNPLLGALGDDLLEMMKRVQANQNDSTSIAQLLRDAETIGANPYLFSLIGKTQSSRVQAQPEWFYDWLEKTRAGDLAAAQASGIGAATGTGAASLSPQAISDFAKGFFASPGFGIPFYTQNPLATIKAMPFAGGGPTGTDTVNAMLTPGEYVISQPAAAALGADFLHAMNSMRFSREDLANIINPPAPRRPMHFAEGGPVGEVPAGSKDVGVPQVQITNHFHLDANDMLSEDQVRRKVIPVLNDVMRREGKSFVK